MLGGLWGETCPYGLRIKEVGWTKRARGFSGWIKERQDKYAHCLRKVSSPANVMATVGDYVYLPYAHLNMNKDVPFKAHSSFLITGTKMLPLEVFTAGVARSIFLFKPQAMMGGEITCYQKEQVPMFVKHLSEQFPIICKELCSNNKEAKKMLSDYSYIGRKAMLRTLTPNVGEFTDVHGGRWTWNGSVLASDNSHASFMLVSKFTHLTITPKGDHAVKITDNKQVNGNTIFKS